MIKQITIVMVSVAFVLSMVCSANAGICSPGDYIGGDSTGLSPSCTNNPSWNPQGGGGLFFANSGDGTSGSGTRAPQRTVNGHMMSAGGTRGILADGGDSGWLGTFDKNEENPAGVTGDNWLSYEFDDVYSLGPIHWWNWNNTAGFGPPNFAGGIKTVQVDYSSTGIEGTFSTLGTFTIPQEADPLTPSAGNSVGDFAGAQANAVVVTIVDSWPMTSDDLNVTSHHSLGSISFDVVEGGPPPPDRTWNVDAQGDWNQGNNWAPASPPNTNNHSAIFGEKITSPRTVSTDLAVTVNSITFLNTNRYVVAGAGTVNLEKNSSAPMAAINVAVGNHEFQARVNLHSDTDVTIASGFTLEFNNRLNLNGNTLSKLGFGEVAINNVLATGGGTINVQAGTISGNGTVGGDVINDGGTISPGSNSEVFTVLAPSSDKMVVPEPSAVVMMGLGLLSVCGFVCRLF